MQDKKYIVFKRDAFYQLMGEFGLPREGDCAPVAQRIQERAEETCLPDAIVIRSQDVFAAPALHSYANAILVALGILGSFEKVVDPVKLVRLMDIADYFHERANEAEQMDSRKLPD